MSTQPAQSPGLSLKVIGGKILLGIAVIWAITLFVCGILAYFVVRKGPAGWVDGLGRPLMEAPMVARIFFGQERMWPGWFWFATDLVVFWGSIALGSFVFGRRGSK